MRIKMNLCIKLVKIFNLALQSCDDLEKQPRTDYLKTWLFTLKNLSVLWYEPNYTITI
jgi:hypothetical protein